MGRPQIIGTEYNVSEEHFNKFVRMFSEFKDMFSLNNWEVRYAYIADGPGEARATLTVFDLGNHLAGVALFSEWDIEPTDYALWRTAFHECMELLLSEMNHLAEARTWNYNEYDREGHRVIRTLETVVFDKMWEREDAFFNIFQPPDEVKKRKGRKVSKPNKR